MRSFPCESTGRTISSTDEELSAWPAAPVVEDEDVPFAGKPGRYPVGIVLVEQPLIHFRAVAIGTRIAPSVKQVAPLATAAPLVTGGLGGRRAVVNDPELAECMNADHDLVELGVVGDRIEVGPVGIRIRPAAVAG